MTMAAKPNPWATWPLSATSFMTMPRANALNRAGVTAEPLTCTSPVAIAGQNLGRGLEADDLDVEPFVGEVSLLLGDEDAGIGHRADGADLERHARIERRGLRRRGRGCDRERSRQARGERGEGETKTHRNSPWCGRRCGRQV